MESYRVEIDDFKGPLDLLLFLVKREEVGLEELPIGRITEQYLKYMEQLEKIDVDQASEYLVMASLLLEMKAKSLLPDRPAVETEGDAYTAERQLMDDLLEYRKLQGEVRSLEKKEDLASLRYGRTTERRRVDRPLGHVDVWDLVTAFKILADQVSSKEAQTTVVEHDQEPVESHIARLRTRIFGAVDGVRFQDVFEDAPSKAALVAMFIALLELIRLSEVKAIQTGPFSEIRILPVSEEERRDRRPSDSIHHEVPRNPEAAK